MSEEERKIGIMSEILKALDRIFNYCEEIDNHLPNEEKTGYKMSKDINFIENKLLSLQQEKQDLIKYLEDKYQECEQYLEYQAWRFEQQVYKEILDILKENK